MRGSWAALSAALVLALALAMPCDALSSVPRRLWQRFDAAAPTRSARSPADPCANGACGEPLYLSPLIAAGNITQALSLAAVTGLQGQRTGAGWSGYLQSNASSGNEMFFWYFPAFAPTGSNPPTVLWLQGGPGASDMWGLFGEVGLFAIDANLNVNVRPTSWNQRYNMLFVDQPCGTGWSQRGPTSTGPVAEPGVASEMVAVLTQFYQLFPALLTSELYVAGESYGGKYGPAVAYAVDQYNAAGGSPAIPLTGLILADGWSDPASALSAYAPLVYAFGLISPTQQQTLSAVMENAGAYLAAGNTQQSFALWNSWWADYNPTGFTSLFTNMTGSSDPENLSDSADDRPFWGFIDAFLSLASTRKALHVGALPFSAVDIYGAFVESGDFMSSILPLMPHLLNQYRVMIYSGANDGICGYTLSDNFITAIAQTGAWDDAVAYIDAERHIWRVSPSDVEVAGFAQTVWHADNTELAFARVVVRGAGHMLPADQPVRAFDMITRFIDGTGWGKPAAA